jgi:glycosyltransferase involved in cell wall biosynthesis
MKKLLLITHEFPPISGGRVLRSLKLAKYLPDYGWETLILTALPQDCFYSHEWWLDPCLAEEIVGKATVYRIPSPLERFAKKIRNRMYRQVQKDVVNQALGYEPGGQAERKGGFRGLKKLRVLQDFSGLWNPYAYRAALHIMRKQPVDAILTTTPPHLLHLVGYWLKKRTGLPWIADFRDGWRGNPLFQADSAIRRLFDNRLEERVVATADIKLAVTENIRTVFQKNYPSQVSSFHLLHNGFDPADFSIGTKCLPENPCSFVYLGNLGGYRKPDNFLLALQQLVESGNLDPNDFIVKFIGVVSEISVDVAPRVNIEILSPIQHHQAIEYMQRAGILLLFAGEEEGEAAFTGKIFEYLAARRPVLAIIPEKGELVELIRSYPLGFLAPPHDIQRIAMAILKAYNHALSPNDEIDCEVITQLYDRRKQAEQLAQLLNGLATGSPSD